MTSRQPPAARRRLKRAADSRAGQNRAGQNRAGQNRTRTGSTVADVLAEADRAGLLNGREPTARQNSPRRAAPTLPQRARRAPSTVRPQRPALARRSPVTAKPAQVKAVSPKSVGSQTLKRRVSRGRKPPRNLFHAGIPRRRLIALFAGTVIVFGAILFRVSMLQTAEAGSYQSAGTSQRTREATLQASRGVIFDRNGDELALSVPATTIYVNPKLVSDPLGTAATLATALQLSADKQQSLADAMTAKTSSFVYVARQLDTATAESVMSLDLDGVESYTEDTRVVPAGDLARGVIGRTDIDGVGIAGIELQFDEILTGIDGERVSEYGPDGDVIPGSGAISRAAVPGQDLVLTIDRSIQFSLEQALFDRVSTLGAKGGTAIVMETGTGNILAMASVERDEDGVYHVTSANKGAVDCYEPGSVAKIITTSAGLNEGVVTPDTYFNVPWARTFNEESTKWKQTIRDAEPHKDEWWNVRDILVHSSNIGTVGISELIGPEKQWEYMTAFGFGNQTALDFPGESNGILRDWKEWEGTEKVTPSYGYGVCVPAIQLVSAFNVIANNGVYVAPRLVQATIGSDGTQELAVPSPSHTVLTPETAAAMNLLMRAVVCDGTATRAQVDGISIAGKTGTGVKPNEDGQYGIEGKDRKYYSSFVGFFPAEAPAVTTLISIDEPPADTQDRFGGTAAAPVFRAVVPAIMHQQGIQPPTANGGCPPK